MAVSAPDLQPNNNHHHQSWVVFLFGPVNLLPLATDDSCSFPCYFFLHLLISFGIPVGFSCCLSGRPSIQSNHPFIIISAVVFSSINTRCFPRTPNVIIGDETCPLR